MNGWVFRSLFGAVAWLIGLAVLHLGWPEALLTFAPLVLVPPALALVPPSKGIGARLARLAGWLQFPAALLVLASFGWEADPLAATLTIPWLLFTFLVALLGLLRLRDRAGWSNAEVALDAGLIYLAVGGGWTILSRYGARPMDFSDTIVLLTAVHFHYAGLILPLLTGLAARELVGMVSRIAAAAIVIGVPLVALGIAFWPTLEVAAACGLAVACVLVGIMQMRLAFRAGHRGAAILFAVSGLSLITAMALAVVYSVGQFCGIVWLDIPEMLPTHGAINAFGFALAGLLAWHLAVRPRLEAWEDRPFSPGIERGPVAGDNRDAHEGDVAVESPSGPEPAGPSRRLAAAILGYDIFPPRLGSGVLRRKPVEVGDTVGLCYHLMPGIDLFFAARVVDRFDERLGDTWRTGFTYRTLAGHPEIGEETFVVEKDVRSGRVTVALRSWSRPGCWWMRWLRPLARLLQLRAGRAAVEHLRALARAGAQKSGDPD